ncbi:hypothetical protein EDM56_16315 [Brevibacillus fluminis]|uniref:Uncharacterized protein n=1 Tax=Brevibacillus fluminis TaxID=511487 RepID=A0A3M8DGU9_9BACL|nr:hypothetical protein [Brevibacillus fluminis]RNB87236.1 hypothetical protein EDM56_16315 [Brevibacillus fluminis]
MRESDVWSFGDLGKNWRSAVTMPAGGRDDRLRQKTKTAPQMPHAARRVLLKEVVVARKTFSFFGSAWRAW